jgi:pimeloyl-ACP methyl ester carboxylesterase
VALRPNCRADAVPLHSGNAIYTDIRYWRDLGKGGHFVMLEHPELLADSIRSFSRQFG